MGLSLAAVQIITNYGGDNTVLVHTAAMCSSTLSLSLRFNGHFPGEPGLAGVF